MPIETGFDNLSQIAKEFKLAVEANFDAITKGSLDITILYSLRL